MIESVGNQRKLCLRLPRYTHNSTETAVLINKYSIRSERFERKTRKMTMRVDFLSTSRSPGCSWFWPHLDHLGPAWTRRSPGHDSSNIPPPHICPDSDTAGPGCSAVWPHLGGPSPGPDGYQKSICSGCLSASVHLSFL